MATVKAADLASSALESRARWRRRRAARRLGRMWGAAAAQHLARVFEFSDDEAVATIARRGLDGVVDQLAIDAVCEQWKANRSPRISELLAQKGWIAEQPVELRVLTALHQDRPEAITGGGPEVAEELLRIAADDGSELRERARGALVSLSDPAAGEAVCAAAIDRGDATALEAAVAADFVPREPAGHALLLFLTGRIERYRDLDFDGGLLRAAYIAAAPDLRARLAAKARADGRLEWVRALTGGRPQERSAELSGKEWETIRAVLVNTRRWEDMWRLTREAPVEVTADLLRELGRSGWLPDENAGRGHCLGLIESAARCGQYPLEKELRTDRPLRDRTTCVAISPDGRMLAASASTGEINLWHLPSGEPAGRIDAKLGTQAGLGFSPDCKVLVSGSHDIELVPEPGSLLGVVGHRRNAQVGCWKLPELTPVRPPSAELGTWVAHSPDGRSLLTENRHGGLTLRRFPSGERVRDLAAGFQSDLEFSADGSLVAAGVGRRTEVWRLPSGKRVVDVPERVGVIAISPDNSMLATVQSGTSTVRLWRLPTGTPAGHLHFEGHYDHRPSLAFTPDAKQLACTDAAGRVQLWQLPSGEASGSITTVGAANEQAWDRRGGRLAISPDGTTLVTLNPTGTGLGVVEAWSLPSGRPIGELHRGFRVWDLSFSREGGLLIGAGLGRSLWMWPLRLMAALRTPVGRIGLGDVGGLRAMPEPNDAERSWIDLIEKLVAWRHRHDIEVDSGTMPFPAGTEIEIGET